MLLNNLTNRPGTALILSLALSANMILISSTPDFIQELNRFNAVILILAYTGLILAYRAIYKSLKEEEQPTVKNFKTVKR